MCFTSYYSTLPTDTTTQTTTVSTTAATTESTTKTPETQPPTTTSISPSTTTSKTSPKILTTQSPSTSTSKTVETTRTTALTSTPKKLPLKLTLRPVTPRAYGHRRLHHRFRGQGRMGVEGRRRRKKFRHFVTRQVWQLIHLIIFWLLCVRNHFLRKVKLVKNTFVSLILKSKEY